MCLKIPYNQNNCFHVVLLLLFKLRSYVNSDWGDKYPLGISASGYTRKV